MLHSYFTFLANFSQDRAREVVEREKEMSRCGTTTPWGQLLGALVQLAGAEKQYLALSFLQPRNSVFLRKEQSLKSVYQTINHDCKQVMEVECGKWLGRVGEVVARLVQGRGSMVDIYERLSGFCPAPPPYREIISVLSAVTEETQRKAAECSVSAPWVTVVKYENNILMDFMSAASSMQAWNFFESIMLLQSGGEKLELWEEILQAREARKLSFATSLLRGVSGSAEPNLFLWFQRLKAALLSKFSLYFYLTLSQQTNSTEMKTLCAKLSLDQSARLAAFQKRADAQSVSVLFDATSLAGFRGRPGYHHLEKEQTQMSGLDLFPVVFSTPGQPSHHFPNLVMILTDQNTDLAMDKTVHFYDGGVGATYFLHLIEPRFYAVIIFEGRRSERDSTINTFIQETALQLRCSKVFAALKPGYKY